MAALAVVPLLWGCVHVQESDTRVAVPPPPAPGSVVQTAPQPPPLSPIAVEVVKLAEAGSSNEVMLAYIQNSRTPFNLGADQIVYIQDLGVPSEIVTAMLNRDNELRSAPPAAVAPVSVPPPVVTPPLTPPPAEPPPVYVSAPPADVAYFYSDLAPYGAWVQVEGIGWCWQPHVVAMNRGWRPYCDSGHWLYTDAGWYWQSDYSWGWAPFHYGRWQLHPRWGWVWLPDRVWGPAWVVWRSQDDYCGWAPLPPHAEFDARSGWRYNGVHVGITFDFGLHADHFTFIAMRDFHERDYAHRRLPPTEVTRVYNKTTIINNYTVVNNTVVNNGVHVDRVAAATRAEIKKVPLRDVPAGVHQPEEKNELVAYRHEVKAPARPVKMVAQKIDEQHSVVQHTAAIPEVANSKVTGSTRSHQGAGKRRGQPGVAATETQSASAASASGRQYPAPKPGQPNSAGPAAARPAVPPKAGAPQAQKPVAAQPVRVEPAGRRDAAEVSKALPGNQAAAKSRPAAKKPQVYEPKGYHQAQDAKMLPSDRRPEPQDNSAQGQRRKNEQ